MVSSFHGARCMDCTDIGTTESAVVRDVFDAGTGFRNALAEGR